MQTDSEVRLAYAHFLDLSRRTAAAGHYAVAYHALMAALHCAEDAEDTARLAEVAGLLRDTKRVVDAIRPPHKLSTHSAHSGRSIFEMGAIEAEAAIRRQECEDRVEELRGMGVGRFGPRPSQPNAGPHNPNPEPPPQNPVG